jgi:hypothetical protein
MRGVARRIRGPILAAVVAAAVMGTAAPALAGPAPATAVPHTIVGKWKISGGIFRFYKTRAKNTYTDQVIRQRKDVFCPKVNDKNKQIWLHQSAKHPRVYTGRWKWFFSDCTFAGWGSATITLWKNYKSATFVSDPPKGQAGSPETYILRRVS